MRRCLVLVWAAAARAEYFDVEEDAFWENDGPQEPRKTVKPKTTAPRIAKRDRAQLSLNQMVTFASQGWIRCVKCIPELRDPGVAAALGSRGAWRAGPGAGAKEPLVWAIQERSSSA